MVPCARALWAWPAGAALALAAPARADEPAAPERVEIVSPTLLPGGAVPRDRLPYRVDRLGGEALNSENGATLPELMGQRLPGVNLNEVQGNPLQPDLSYRGFAASPALGTPQGLSVFLDGVRVNEAFGDIVNWDLLPQAAVGEVLLMPGSNPLYGLNTLGAAIAMQTKSGLSHPGGYAEVIGGSFGRVSGEWQYGGSDGEGRHAYAAATLFGEQGWRPDTPSRVGQLFLKVGRHDAAWDVDLSAVGAATNLFASALVPQSMLALDPASVYTRPDQTRNQLAMLTLAATRRFGAEGALAGTAYLRNVRTHTLNGDVNDDYAAELAAGAVDVPAAVENRTSTRQSVAGVALQWSATQGMHQYALGLTLGTTRSDFQQSSALGEFDGARQVIVGAPSEVENALAGRSDYAGLYATDTVTLQPGLWLTLSGRYNAARVVLQDEGPSAPALDGTHHYSSFNPALGLSWQWHPESTLYGGFTQGSRVPTPIELGCADPVRPCTLPTALAADPPLEQVITRTVEAGLRGRIGERARWSIGAWRASTANDILFVGTTTSAGYFTNFGQTARRGLDLAASGSNGPFDWGASYSYVRATYASAACVVSANNSTRGTFTQCSPQDPAHPGLYLGEDLIAVAPGARLPGIPAHSLKLNASWAIDERWRVGLQFVAYSAQFVRGNENNLHQPGTYSDLDGVSRSYLGQGHAAGYGVLGVSARYTLPNGVELFARVANVLDKSYASAGALATNPFGADGQFEMDPLHWQRETFYAPGAPRAAWLGVRVAY